MKIDQNEKNWESRDQRAKRCQNGGTRLKLARLN